MIRRGRRAAIGVLATLVLAAACTGPDEGSSSEASEKRGGELRVGITAPFGLRPNLDPQENAGTGLIAEIARCCLQRTLMSYSGGTTEQGGAVPKPDLAASLPEVSADGLVWTFHLRRGIHYAPPLQDVEVTAADFIRSFERMMSHDLIPGWSEYSSTLMAPMIRGAEAYLQGEAPTIEGLEAPDPATLRVGLTAPQGSLAHLLATLNTGPIPPNPADPAARFGVATGHPADYGSYFVATGPYMLAGAEAIDFSLPPVRQIPAAGIQEDEVVLVRNPSWSDDPLRAAEPDRIVLRLVETAEGDDDALDARALEGIETGAFDTLLTQSPLSSDRLAELEEDRILEARGDVLRFSLFNLASPPFDDVHVRRAVNYVVDVAAAVDHVRSSTSVATHMALDSQLDNLLVNWSPFRPDDRGADLGAARGEMALSVYDTDGDGRCDADACRGFTVVGGVFAPGDRELARTIAQGLRALGLAPRLVISQNLFEYYGNPDRFAMMINAGLVKDYPSASTLFPQFLSSEGISRPGSPVCCNDTMLGASADQLAAWGFQVRDVPSADDRIARCEVLPFEDGTRCWAELDQYLMEELAVWLPLYEQLTFFPMSERVESGAIDQGVAFPQPSLDRFRLTLEAAAESGSPLPEATVPLDPLGAPIPDGTYRATVSMEAARAIGARIAQEEGEDFDPDFWAAQNAGVYTLELADGRWKWLQTEGELADLRGFAGWYAGRGDRLELVNDRLPLAGPSETMTLRWSSIGGGGLRFRVESASFWGASPSLKFREAYAAMPWAAAVWEPVAE